MKKDECDERWGKVVKLLLCWVIIFIVGIAGGQLGKYMFLRQKIRWSYRYKKN